MVPGEDWFETVSGIGDERRLRLPERLSVLSGVLISDRLGRVEAIFQQMVGTPSNAHAISKSILCVVMGVSLPLIVLAFELDGG